MGDEWVHISTRISSPKPHKPPPTPSSTKLQINKQTNNTLSKMEEPTSSSTINTSNPTKITDIDIDSLTHCARYLTVKDISNLSLSCKFFKSATYSDSIWLPLFRKRWSEEILGQYCLPGLTLRHAYLTRLTHVLRFGFVDPLVADLYTDGKPVTHLLLLKDCLIFSQGSLIQILKIGDFINGKDCIVGLRDHNARVTCMRSFDLSGAYSIRSESQNEDNLLITSSCDRSIRLWWKGSCIRCFRGHSGPVLTLSDKLLGDNGCNLLASGGEDGTVRLWSLGKRGSRPLSATLHGHDKPVKLITVAGHKPSLLISVATDSKIRVWDSALAAASRMSSCVGMTSLPGAPLGIRCFESMLYVASGSSVHALDLRTMRKAFTAAVCLPDLYSFEMLPSRSLVCTGGSNSALLWDIRKSQDGSKPQPMAELSNHNGSVTYLHMDPYKIVTGGPDDFYTNVWDVKTSALVNSLGCCASELSNTSKGCNAMAVDGSRIATASCGESVLLRYRDFENASSSVSSYEEDVASKFWKSRSYSDSDSDNEVYM